MVGKSRKEIVQGMLDLYRLLSKEEQQQFIQESRKEPGFVLPISIFRRNLSALQAIVFFLKTNKHQSTTQIARLLHRKPTTISSTYAAAKRKIKGKLDVSDTSMTIPLSVFASRKYPVLETLIVYLKEHYNLRLIAISRLLAKNYNTIKVTYARFRKRI
ncbi:hypothetical protein CL620_03795 [archaeon]|nr:hypothetical protein [archaeon]